MVEVLAGYRPLVATDKVVVVDNLDTDTGEEGFVLTVENRRTNLIHAMQHEHGLFIHWYAPNEGEGHTEEYWYK